MSRKIAVDDSELPGEYYANHMVGPLFDKLSRVRADNLPPIFDVLRFVNEMN